MEAKVSRCRESKIQGKEHSQQHGAVQVQESTKTRSDFEKNSTGSSRKGKDVGC